MRFRTVLHIVSVIVLIVAGAMLVPIATSLWYGGKDLVPLLVSEAITVVSGLALFATTRLAEGEHWLGHRDAYLTTVAGWAAACLFGALPFFLYAHWLPVDPQWAPEAALDNQSVCDLPLTITHPGQEFCSVTNVVFESVSGFTTTGSSVLRSGLWDSLDSSLSNGKPGLDHGILLWRSLIQWLGGMGILVLAVSVLALVGIGGLHLMRAEVPGPTTGKLSPRISDTARILWKVYVIISAGEVFFLMIGGMSLYHALNHTFTTMATGGFSPLSASVAGMNSPYFEWVIIFFMFLAGSNFTLHYYLLFSRRFDYHRDSEFKTYFGITLATVLVTVAALYGVGLATGFEPAVRASFFQTVSILTTTGYATEDFTLWPQHIQLLLLVLMFVGGCAGSTGGGMKVVRMQAVGKVGYRELFRIAHPQAVIPVRIGRAVVTESTVQAILGVVLLFVATFVLSSLIMAAMGLDLVTALSSVAACLGNIGPGLGKVGPASNFFDIPGAGKWVLSLNMLAGRLEIYTVLILFTPHFWRR